MIRVRGPFSVAIFLLALLETIHWSLGVGDVYRPEFLEREVGNLRLSSTSYLSSGDNISRIASKLAERETGRKHSPGQGGIEWSEIERELSKRFREEKQLEVSSRSLKVSELSERNNGLTDLLKSLGVMAPTRAAQSSPKSTGAAAASASNHSTHTIMVALLYMLVTVAQALLGSATDPAAGSSVSPHNRRKAFAARSLFILPLLFAPVISATQLESNPPLSLLPLVDSSATVSPADGGPHVYISAPLGAPTSSGECDLQCWLSRLVIHIPDQKFEKLGITGTVSQGVCTGIAFADLQSSLVPPFGVSFAAAGLSVHCTLDWSLSALVFSASGSADAVVNNSRLGVAVQLQKDADGLAGAANVTSCAADIVVSSLEFHGDLSIFLDFFSAEVSAIISSSLDSVICSQLTTLVQTNLTNALQEVDTIIRPYLKPRPPVTPPVVPPGMVDLEKDPLVALLDYVLDDVMGADGILGLNKIVDALTNGTGRVAVSNITGLSVPVPVASLGVITLGLRNVSVSGLNSWGVFDVLEPAGPYNLSSHTLLDTLSLSVAFSINVSVNGSLGGAYLYEEAVLSAHLVNNTLQSSLLVAVSQAAVKGLNDNQKIVPGCLLSTLHDINMTQLDFSFVLAQLELLATNGGAEEQVDTAINNVFALLTRSFQAAIPALFNGVVAGPVRLLTNSGFAALLNLKQPCSDPANPETFNKESTIVAFSGAGAVFAVMVVVCIVALFITQIPTASSSPAASDAESLAPLIDDDRHHHHQRQRQRPASAGVVVVDDDPMAPTPAEKAEAEAGARSKWLSALVLSPRFPYALRFGIVLLLLGNIALFISSNTSVGASVYAYVTLGGETTKLPSLFDFSLGNSVTDMWSAKVYALSLLIAIFSGGWPYLKLLMLLVCWIVPTNLLSRTNRERVLMALDVLGKWSLIDAFVLTLMMVAFHFHIVPPVSPHTPPGTASVDAFVEPHWGFYSFLLATMMSLAATHVILACHRAESAKPSNAPKSDPYSAFPPEKQKWESLCCYAFKSTPWLARFSWLITLVVTCLLLFSIALLAAGSVLDSFQFQFKGAFQMLLHFLGDESFTSYSIISTGLALPGSAASPDSFGVRFIQVTWFCFAIAIPLCYLLLLLVLWLTPLTPRLQRGVFVVTEVFNAWSALEVVVVSIIAALLELQQFSLFIIGDRCDLINPVLEKYFGTYLGGDARCFDVVASLDDGCWFLFAACLIYIIVGLSVQITCHKALREREGELQDASKNAFPININGDDDDAPYSHYYRHDTQED